MVRLSDASSIQNTSTAIHSVIAWGMAMSMLTASAAPIRKYGRRRPKRVQVLSE